MTADILSFADACARRSASATPPLPGIGEVAPIPVTAALSAPRPAIGAATAARELATAARALAASLDGLRSNAAALADRTASMKGAAVAIQSGSIQICDALGRIAALRHQGGAGY